MGSVENPPGAEANAGMGTEEEEEEVVVVVTPVGSIRCLLLASDSHCVPWQTKPHPQHQKKKKKNSKTSAFSSLLFRACLTFNAFGFALTAAVMTSLSAHKADEAEADSIG